MFFIKFALLGPVSRRSAAHPVHQLMKVVARYLGVQVELSEPTKFEDYALVADTVGLVGVHAARVHSESSVL